MFARELTAVMENTLEAVSEVVRAQTDLMEIVESLSGQVDALSPRDLRRPMNVGALIDCPPIV